MNCYELSQYFLSDKYKDHINQDNPIGTGGVLARAYASLLKNVYNGTSSSYSPWDFKRAIGGFQTMFMGYQQHDTMEFLNYLLDGLHEDLNKVLKKPAVEKDETAKDDKIKSEEQFIGFLRRNQSVLVNLMYGQYKSTLYCPNTSCENISTTFDPFLSLTLPILHHNESYSVKVYYLPYDIQNKPVQILFDFNCDCTVMALRNKVGKILSIHPMSFLVVKMNDDGNYEQYLSTKRLVKTNREDVFTFFLFQINPEYFYSKENAYYEHDYLKKYRFDNSTIVKHVDSRLKDIYPLLAEDYDEDDTGITDDVITYYSKRTVRSYSGDEVEIKKMCVDNNYGFGKDWLRLVINMKLNSYDISTRKRLIFQRVIYIHTSWTTKKLHYEIFKYFFHLFVLKEEITVEDKSNIDYEKYFVKFFGESFSPQTEEDTLDFQEKKKYPYRLRIFSIVNESRKSTCYHCKKNGCHDCLLPFDDNLTIRNLIDRIPKNDQLEIDNNFFFLSPYLQNRIINRDFMVELSWLQDYHKVAISLNEKDDIDFKLPKAKKVSSLPLADCFRNFMKIEKLQSPNEWYCPQCKTHQLAKKQMEVFKAPPILILHLKRFTNNSKLGILIDYPLKNLDLSPFINHNDGTSKKYDLFAVSNHYGGMGGGHYVAYAQNYFNKKWYTFDDSWCSEMREEDVVVDSGYVLFYRRQDIGNLNLEEIYNAPHVDYESMILEKQNSRKKEEETLVLEKSNSSKKENDTLNDIDMDEVKDVKDNDSDKEEKDGKKMDIDIN